MDTGSIQVNASHFTEKKIFPDNARLGFNEFFTTPAFPVSIPQESSPEARNQTRTLSTTSTVFTAPESPVPP